MNEDERESEAREEVAEATEGGAETGAALNRRQFLGGVSSSALGATLVSGLAGAAVASLAGTEAQADGGGDDCEIGPESPVHRRNIAHKIKLDAAKDEKQLGVWHSECNEDEDRYPNYIGNYHKGLPHDPVTGEVDPPAYDAMARRSRTATSRRSTRCRASATCSSAARRPRPSTSSGPDYRALPVAPPAPSIDSAESGGGDGRAVLDGAPARRPVLATGHTDPSTWRTGVRRPRQQPAPATRSARRLDHGDAGKGCFRMTRRAASSAPTSPRCWLPRLHLRRHDLVVMKSRTLAAGRGLHHPYPEWTTAGRRAALGLLARLDPVMRWTRSPRDVGPICAVDRDLLLYLRAYLILRGRLRGQPLHRASTPTCRTNDCARPTSHLWHGALAELVGSREARASHLVLKWNVHRNLRPEAYGGLVHREIQTVRTTRSTATCSPTRPC